MFFENNKISAKFLPFLYCYFSNCHDFWLCLIALFLGHSSHCQIPVLVRISVFSKKTLILFISFGGFVLCIAVFFEIIQSMLYSLVLWYCLILKTIQSLLYPLVFLIAAFVFSEAVKLSSHPLIISYCSVWRQFSHFYNLRFFRIDLFSR